MNWILKAKFFILNTNYMDGIDDFSTDASFLTNPVLFFSSEHAKIENMITDDVERLLRMNFAQFKFHVL